MQTRIRRKETNHNFYTYDCEGEDETEGAVSERAKNHEEEEHVGIVLIVGENKLQLDSHLTKKETFGIERRH